jgi:hypothetical protein
MRAHKLQRQHTQTVRRHWLHVRSCARRICAPQPFESWTLDENNDWQPPTPKPDGHYYWDENLLVWVEYDKQKN